MSIISVLYLLMLLNSAMANQNGFQVTNRFTDSIIIKSTASGKNMETKLYSTSSGATLYFSSTGVNGKVFQLFLFDMDGRLTKLSQVRYRETTALAQLEKGQYMFEVFSRDDRIENGSITIR